MDAIWRPAATTAEKVLASDSTNVTRPIRTRASGNTSFGYVNFPDQSLIENHANRAIIQACAQKTPRNHSGEEEEGIVADILVQ